MSRDLAITQIWRLVDVLSRTLDPAEREAVCGDFTESGETGSQALLDVLGLVVRRQTALWRTWRPWLALAGLVVPLGMLLSLVSRNMADGSAIFIWFYANNWDWKLLENAGFWYGFASCAPGILISYLALTCWSWTSGLLLASVSRHTIWSNGALFCLTLLSGELLGAPRFLGHVLLLQRARAFDPNREVFALGFYRVMFPLIVQAVLVLLPAVWGMRQSLRLRMLPLPCRAILWTSAIATPATLATQDLVWWQLRVWQVWPLRFPRLPSLMPFAVVGPLGYMIATAAWRRWQRYQVVSH